MIWSGEVERLGSALNEWSVRVQAGWMHGVESAGGWGEELEAKSEMRSILRACEIAHARFKTGSIARRPMQKSDMICFHSVPTGSVKLTVSRRHHWKLPSQRSRLLPNYSPISSNLQH